MKNEIIQALLDEFSRSTDYVSGADLSQRLGISRAAVSKAVQGLAASGISIESVKHHGYRLRQLPDVLIEPFIAHVLKANHVFHLGQRIRPAEQVDSTNLAARRGAEAGDPDGTLYIAEEQTAGRGRRGKSWQSHRGEGLWFSLLLKPDQRPEELTRLTLFAGLCAAIALRDLTGLDVRIKWPNDLIVLPSCKKISGILTEMIVEENRVSAIVLGIGVNVHTLEFPEDLQSIATSIDLALSEAAIRVAPDLAPQATATPGITRIDILAAILKHFETRWPDFGRITGSAESKPANSATNSLSVGEPVWLEEYRALCATLGRSVRVTDVLGQSRDGEALSIDAGGDLIVAWPDGRIEAVNAGEVSVRGLLGYT